MLTQETNTVFINHFPTSHAFKKSIYYAGVQSVNNLPSDLKCLMNEKGRPLVPDPRYFEVEIPIAKLKKV
jgi:hypothetical protein